MPELDQMWWYHAALGRTDRLLDNAGLADASLANAHDYMLANRPEFAVDEIRRAEAMHPLGAVHAVSWPLPWRKTASGPSTAANTRRPAAFGKSRLSLSAINPTPWYGLSLYYLREKDFDQASRCLDQLVRLHEFFGYRRLTLRGQAYVLKSWAAARRGDGALADAMYCLSIQPKRW